MNMLGADYLGFERTGSKIRNTPPVGAGLSPARAGDAEARLGASVGARECAA
jgi:hypothetical protein